MANIFRPPPPLSPEQHVKELRDRHEQRIKTKLAEIAKQRQSQDRKAAFAARRKEHIC